MPFGFGINTLLLAMPGLSYAQIGPPGIAAALLFLAGGWLLDQLTAPPRPAGPRPVGADPADRIGLVRLVLHVAALGGQSLPSARWRGWISSMRCCWPCRSTVSAGRRGWGCASRPAQAPRSPASPR